MDTKELYPGYGEDVRLTRVVPAPRQIAHQELEYFGFIHFTVNTFKGQMRPWTSWESPKPTGKGMGERGGIPRYFQSGEAGCRAVGGNGGQGRNDGPDSHLQAS